MKWKNQLKAVVAGEPLEGDVGLFGACVPTEAAQLVILPAPWDSTASYGKGTASGPVAVSKASLQLDYFDLDFDTPVLAGIALDHTDTLFPHCATTHVPTVNAASRRINDVIWNRSRELLGAGQLVAVLGGEHSVPYGLIKALAEINADFGILHVDAHHDLRQAYEGYDHSHASIMYNVLEDFQSVSRLVSVGIRDFAQDEFRYARSHGQRVVTFYDQHLQERKAKGEGWASIAKEIVAALPQQVYISFDIDGLDPALCPHTGTPVPGGLGFAEAMYLIKELHSQQKTIIGFDLCEVAPNAHDEWDANVGARILYKLCGAALVTNGRKYIV